MKRDLITVISFFLGANGILWAFSFQEPWIYVGLLISCGLFSYGAIGLIWGAKDDRSKQ